MMAARVVIDSALATEALDFFLETGKRKETLRWIRTDGFPRETAWEGREGREAWKKRQRASKDDQPR